jgi:hypothetical protein
VSGRRRIPIVPPHISHDACTPGLRRELLRENPLFRDLTGKQVDVVNQTFRDQGFETGETIVREGEPADHLYIVALGIVKLFRSTEAGDSALVDVLGSVSPMSWLHSYADTTPRAGWPTSSCGSPRNSANPGRAIR